MVVISYSLHAMLPLLMNKDEYTCVPMALHCRVVNGFSLQ